MNRPRSGVSAERRKLNVNPASKGSEENGGFLPKADTPTGPVLPADVVTKTSAKYLEAYERLTGKKL